MRSPEDAPTSLITIISIKYESFSPSIVLSVFDCVESAPSEKVHV